MEQPDSCKCHHHTVLVAALYHRIIPHGSPWLCNIFYTALMGSLNIVGEGEKGIAPQSHILHFIKPCALFLPREHGGLFFEGSLPDALRQYIHILIPYINVNSVVPVRSAQTLYKLEIHNLRGLAQEPIIRLLARQSGTVNTGLLSGADADCLPALYISNGI